MGKNLDVVSPGSDLIADSASKIERLCQTYDYPPEVRSLLEQLTTIVQLPGTKSIVLSGSASRGELVHVGTASGLSLFSDLELSVVADHLAGQDVKESLSRVDSLERQQWRVGARTFHIDVDFVSLQDWSRKQDKFQAWETRQTGWILYGEDTLGLFKVDVNPQTTIQSSLNRLWYLLLYFPERLLRRDPNEDDLQVFNYALNRAILDFPLWLLVHREVLVSGFAGRRKYLAEHLEDFRQKAFPIDELMKLVDAAMQDRHTPALARDVVTLYEAVLRWYPRTIAWTLDLPETTDAAAFSATLQEHSHKLYAPLDWKRYAWETRLVSEIGAGSSPAVALKWLREKKQVVITTFLWCMHQAVAQYMTGSAANADDWLRSASSSMGSLWPARRGKFSEGSFIENWIALRRSFFDFIMLFYRGLKAKELYYRVVLDVG